jgi:hypothetical protein
MKKSGPVPENETSKETLDSIELVKKITKKILKKSKFVFSVVIL